MSGLDHPRTGRCCQPEVCDTNQDREASSVWYPHSPRIFSLKSTCGPRESRLVALECPVVVGHKHAEATLAGLTFHVTFAPAGVRGK